MYDINARLCRYARDLAAESLRRHENDFQKALDALTSPEVNSSIQVYIESRKRKRQEQQVGITVDELVSMGFERGQGTFSHLDFVSSVLLLFANVKNYTISHCISTLALQQGLLWRLVADEKI